MSQNPQPQEPGPFDYNPAYNQLYEGRDAGQGADGEARNVPTAYQPAGAYTPPPAASTYPGNVPGNNVTPPGFLEEGQKAAQRSLTFGIISVVLILLMYWIPYSTLGSIILGALGISAARDAERHGVPAKAGRILSWIGVVLPIALTVLAMIALLILLFTLKG